MTKRVFVGPIPPAGRFVAGLLAGVVMAQGKAFTPDNIVSVLLQDWDPPFADMVTADYVGWALVYLKRLGVITVEVEEQIYRQLETVAREG